MKHFLMVRNIVDHFMQELTLTWKLVGERILYDEQRKNNFFSNNTQPYMTQLTYYKLQ